MGGRITRKKAVDARKTHPESETRACAAVKANEMKYNVGDKLDRNLGEYVLPGESFEVSAPGSHIQPFSIQYLH